MAHPETPDARADGDDALLDAGDHPEPPTFDPARFDAPAYDDITTEADLKAYSRAYLGVVIAYYDLEVDAGHIQAVEVSRQAKRRAAAVISPDLSQLGVFTTAGLTNPDWDALREEHNDTAARAGFDDIKNVRVRLTWGAFEAFSEQEWRETIRHEAIHIEQYHRYGDGGHGLGFMGRARELQSTTDCPQFTDYTYPFQCTACGGDAGGRYQDCPAVESARNEDGEWTSNCCDAPITLREA